MTDQITVKKQRGPATKLTKREKRNVLLNLKSAALAGDVTAAAALFNHELAEMTRKRMELDSAAA